MKELYWSYLPVNNIYLEGSLTQKLENIFNLFGIEANIISEGINEKTFGPIFDIQYGVFTFTLNVSRVLLEDMVQYFSMITKYKKSILFIDKNAFFKGILKISSKYV